MKSGNIEAKELEREGDGKGVVERRKGGKEGRREGGRRNIEGME